MNPDVNKVMFYLAQEMRERNMTVEEIERKMS